MGAVYRLTLRQLTGRWRLAIMTVLAALPVVLAILMLRSEHAPSVRDFENAVLSVMLAGSIAPLVVLAIAAAAFGNEVEDRTLANLTLSPVPRWRIAVPKLLATITVAGPFIAASAFATAWVAFLGDPAAVLAVTVVGARRRRALRRRHSSGSASSPRRRSASDCSTSCSGRASSPASCRGCGC